MPRVVYRGSGFERVPSTSWLEKEFENLVYQRSMEIFPRWIPARFTASVSAHGETKRPDLALIDPHYRAWWVVEVELQHHPLRAHVLPQIRVFAEGDYGAKHADWLAEHNPHLDRDRLRAMLQGEPPSVLGVVDAPGTGWEYDFDIYRAKLAIVEPFRDAAGEYLLRVNGYQPEPAGQVLTRCRRELTRLWSVESPAALPKLAIDHPMQISFQGEVAIWEVLIVGGRPMLRAQRGDPLAAALVVDLVLREDQTLQFVAQAPRRGAKK